VEPPVPAGLGRLNGPLRAVVDFLSIDEDLLAEAATASPALERADGQRDIADWIASPGRRTVAELLDAAEARRTAREAAKAERELEQAEREKAARAAASRRPGLLDRLAKAGLS
jgi:hypothetical protein